MKLNRKGFMMAEVVVVSVIICTVLVTLYTALARINNAYDTRNRYYDIDTLYFTEEVNDMLIYMGYINEYISTNDSKEVNLNNVFSNPSIKATLDKRLNSSFKVFIQALPVLAPSFVSSKSPFFTGHDL